MGSSSQGQPAFPVVPNNGPPFPPVACILPAPKTFKDFQNLPLELRYKMINMAIHDSTSSKKHISGLATVNKDWQVAVDKMRFRCITVDLEARPDNMSADHLTTILNPTRVAYMKRLTLRITWPFFRYAQEAEGRFSVPKASHSFQSSLKKLTCFLSTLSKVAAGVTAQHLTISLEPCHPLWAPHPIDQTRRVQTRALIETMWSDSDLQRLSSRQARRLANLASLICAFPDMPMVTGLVLAPDLFPHEITSSFFWKFPNLKVVDLQPMGSIGMPGIQTHNIDLLTSKLPSRAPQVSTLVLGKSKFHQRAQYGLDQWIKMDPEISAFSDSLRNYSTTLEKLDINNYACATSFYSRFFQIPTEGDQPLRWSKLRELHIAMDGNKNYDFSDVQPIPTAQNMPSKTAQGPMSGLFYAAGVAAEQMPVLEKMTIHLPRRLPYPYHWKGITLQFTVQLGQWTPFSAIQTADLHLWNLDSEATENILLGQVWTRSIAVTRRLALEVEWHGEECPKVR